MTDIEVLDLLTTIILNRKKMKNQNLRVKNKPKYKGLKKDDLSLD